MVLDQADRPSMGRVAYLMRRSPALRPAKVLAEQRLPMCALPCRNAVSTCKPGRQSHRGRPFLARLPTAISLGPGGCTPPNCA